MRCKNIVFALVVIGASFLGLYNDTFAQTVTTIDLEITDGVPSNNRSTRIHFGNGSGYTTGLNPGFDAGLFPTSIEVYTLLVVDDATPTGTPFDVQTLPFAEIGDMTIEVGTIIPTDTTITFTISISADPLPAGHRVILEDRDLGVFTELQGASDSYTATIIASDPEIGRFYLHTTSDAISPVGPASITNLNVPTNAINDTFSGSCGADSSLGSVVITTTPVNGFSNLYNELVYLDTNGDFAISNPNWSEGVYGVNLDCTDKVGNGPTNFALSSFIVDLTPPLQTAPVDLQAGSDTGVLNTDNLTSDPTPTLDLACSETGSTLALYTDNPVAGTLIDTYSCTSTATFSVTLNPVLADGTHGLSLEETDQAGNISTASNTLNLRLDTTMLPTTIDVPTKGEPVSGTAEPNSSVSVNTPSGSTCSVTTDVGGNWSCTLAPTPVDGENITAVTVDDAGNNASTTEVAGIDRNAPTNPTVDVVEANDTIITGTGENGTIITLNIGGCTNAPVVVSSGVWSCTLNDSDKPSRGTTITATSTDTAGNFSSGSYRIPRPASGGSSRPSVCKDKEALNYNDDRFARHKESKCKYADQSKSSLVERTVSSEPTTTTNPFGGVSCPASLVLTDNMKVGDRNGKYSSYNKANVTQVDLLQTHMNRLLLDRYGNQASGPIDGIFGKQTKLGVERLQRRLNELLPNKKPLDVDGVVGQFTRQAINNSCDGIALTENETSTFSREELLESLRSQLSALL